jgi:hypothetical protein
VVLALEAFVALLQLGMTGKSRHGHTCASRKNIAFMILRFVSPRTFDFLGINGSKRTHSSSLKSNRMNPPPTTVKSRSALLFNNLAGYRP